MKQFDLKEYLKDPNKKVVTRDGRNVRIICTDKRKTIYPIIALCFMEDGSERLSSYLPNGKEHVGEDSNDDLFFAPEKHEGWTHVYKLGDAGYIAGNIYNTKEETLKHPIASKISTVKIEWEE